MVQMPHFSVQPKRDHGGGLDAAIEKFGGLRAEWLDLSTGINPVPYPLPHSMSGLGWDTLPDRAAQEHLVEAARHFWNVPDGAAILAAPGASVLIAMMPTLNKRQRVSISTPTYNEHAAAFAAHGWDVREDGDSEARVIVHPNNPDGRLWSTSDVSGDLTVIDESFCDVCPERSLIHLAERPGVIVLKSFGKFWGLAGLRLGFAIARPETIAELAGRLGPWPVAGPALAIGAQALGDLDWAEKTRQRLSGDASRLDGMMQTHGATLVGGTDLFRLYSVENAGSFQDQLARNRIWTRIFPYSDRFIRLGIPAPSDWDRLEAAF